MCVCVRLWTRTARRSKKSRRQSNPCAAQDTVWVSSWGNGDGDGGSVYDVVACGGCGAEHAGNQENFSQALERLGGGSSELGGAFVKFSGLVKELAALLKNLVSPRYSIICSMGGWIEALGPVLNWLFVCSAAESEPQCGLHPGLAAEGRPERSQRGETSLSLISFMDR